MGLREQYLRDGYLQRSYPEIVEPTRALVRAIRDVQDLGQPQSWTYQTINNSLFFKSYIFAVACSVAEDVNTVLDATRLGTISPVFRMDKPGDDKHLRAWHQDSNYFLETESGDKACVLWIPLVPANKWNGAITVCPGSHQYGRWQCQYTPPEGGASEQFYIPDDVASQWPQVQVEAEVGDVLFVHMDLLHRSNPNVSKNTRYTAQIRLADIGDPSYSPVQLRPKYDVAYEDRSAPMPAPVKG